MTIRETVTKAWQSTLLIVVLVAAQAALAGHVETDDGHPGADNCVLCASLGSLGAANVGGTQLVVASFGPERLAPPPTPGTSTARVAIPEARGPPTTS